MSLSPARSYLLDTGIVLGFQKSGSLDDLTRASTRARLVIVEEVFDEVTEPRNGKHAEAAKEAKQKLQASAVDVHSIAVGSPAASTFTALRQGKLSATADLGEAASIAVGVHKPDLTFVTNDAAAGMRGLQELRGRTLSFHPFLALLVEDGALVRRRAEEIGNAIQGLRDWGAVQPVWWSDWVLNRG